MTEGVDLAYSSNGLAAGARELAGASTAAAAAATALRTARLEPVMFGRTPGALVFAATVAIARDTLTRGCQAEQERSSGLRARTAIGADLADGLTEESATVARSSTPNRP